MAAIGAVLDNWHAEFDQAVVILEPGETATINVNVTAPTVSEEQQAVILIQGLTIDGVTIDYGVIVATLSTWMNDPYIEELMKIINETTLPQMALDELNSAISLARQPITLEQPFDRVRRAIKILIQEGGFTEVVEKLLNTTRVTAERAAAYASIQRLKDSLFIEKAWEQYEEAISITDCACAMKKYTQAYMFALRHQMKDYYLFKVTISPETQIKPSETANYTITLTNTGILDDKYNLLLITGINSIWINFSITNIEIPANSSATILLQFTPPSDLLLMYNTTYQFEIRATSVYAIDINDVALTKSVSQTLTVIATKESKTRYIITEVKKLITTLEGMNIPHGIKNSLKAKLKSALENLNESLVLCGISN
jgi:uncharacterized membrane protein